jgi:hypothetical protein
MSPDQQTLTAADVVLVEFEVAQVRNSERSAAADSSRASAAPRQK